MGTQTAISHDERMLTVLSAVSMNRDASTRKLEFFFVFCWFQESQRTKKST